MAGTKWLAVLCCACALAVSGCGGPISVPQATGQQPGVLTGVAGQCSGPAAQPKEPVEVIVYRGDRVVAKQTKLGSHEFRFSMPAGRYRVTTNQSYVMPVDVTLHSGRMSRVSVFANCD